MILQFTLSMPGCSSWNGKWSGSSKFYALTKSFTSKKSKERGAELLNNKYYSYNFGDGWRAGIEIKEIDSQEARKVRKNSNGFCGYDWMMTSILNHGEIKI